MRTITSLEPIVAMTLMVFGKVHPIIACREISGGVRKGSFGSYSSSTIVHPYSKSSWDCLQWWPGKNFSSQLKQSPCDRCLCISSHDNFLNGIVVLWEWQVLQVEVEISIVWATVHPAFELRLIASFNVLGLNIRISSAISSLSPPMKVLTSAFWDQPCTRFPSFSNSYWYSRKDPSCRILERVSLKSSQSVGPNHAHNSSQKDSQVTSCCPSLHVRCNHCHHWLALPSKWKEANGTFCVNGSTFVNHFVGSPHAKRGNSSFANLEENGGLAPSHKFCDDSPVRWDENLECWIEGYRLSEMRWETKDLESFEIVISNWCSLSATPSSIQTRFVRRPLRVVSKFSIYYLLVVMALIPMLGPSQSLLEFFGFRSILLRVRIYQGCWIKFELPFHSIYWYLNTNATLLDLVF